MKTTTNLATEFINSLLAVSVIIAGFVIYI